MKLAKIVIQKTFLRWLLFGGLANIAICQQAENKRSNLRIRCGEYLLFELTKLVAPQTGATNFQTGL